MSDVPPPPRLTAHFLEPDDRTDPLLRAIGRAVWGVAALEKMLLAEVVRRRAEREGMTPELAGLVTRLEEHGTAGVLLGELRALDLAEDLERRIRDLVARRNEFVHHLAEDPVIVRGIVDPEGMDEAVAHVEQLALDSAALAVELHLPSLDKFETIAGISLTEFVEHVKRVDPADVSDPRTRRQVEAVLAFGDVDFSALLDELLDPAPGGDRDSDSLRLNGQ